MILFITFTVFEFLQRKNSIAYFNSQILNLSVRVCVTLDLIHFSLNIRLKKIYAANDAVLTAKRCLYSDILCQRHATLACQLVLINVDCNFCYSNLTYFLITISRKKSKKIF